MDDLTQPSSSPAPAAAPADWQEAYRSLRAMFHLVVLALIFLCGSLAVFFLKEIAMIRREVDTYARSVVDFEKNSASLIQDFRVKMETFAKMHPDFRPLVTKYYGTNQMVAAPPVQKIPPPAAGTK